jgi:hypothetical protein
MISVIPVKVRRELSNCCACVAHTREPPVRSSVRVHSESPRSVFRFSGFIFACRVCRHGGRRDRRIVERAAARRGRANWTRRDAAPGWAHRHTAQVHKSCGRWRSCDRSECHSHRQSLMSADTPRCVRLALLRSPSLIRERQSAAPTRLRNSYSTAYRPPLNRAWRASRPAIFIAAVSWGDQFASPERTVRAIMYQHGRARHSTSSAATPASRFRSTPSRRLRSIVRAFHLGAFVACRKP